MLRFMPLMIVPFALYNLVVAGWAGTQFAYLETVVTSFPMMSGANWSMDVGDTLITIALVMLFIEIAKATRAANSVVDHLISTLLFVAFLVEFLLVPNAATDVFFILMVIAFIDVIAGFTVSIRSASRDVSIGL